MSDQKFIVAAGVLVITILLIPIVILLKRNLLGELQKRNRTYFIGVLCGLCIGVVFGIVKRNTGSIEFTLVSQTGYIIGLLFFLKFIYTVYKQE